MKNAPRIAATPTINGIADAARAPKTNVSSMNVKGIDISSAIFKSSEIFSVIACPTTAAPPAYKVSPSYEPSYFFWNN